MESWLQEAAGQCRREAMVIQRACMVPVGMEGRGRIQTLTPWRQSFHCEHYKQPYTDHQVQPRNPRSQSQDTSLSLQSVHGYRLSILPASLGLQHIKMTQNGPAPHLPLDYEPSRADSVPFAWDLGQSVET